jgi:phosphomannomutase
MTILINKAIFRSYDIRGNSSDINPIIAYKIGFCFTKITITEQGNKKQDNKICIARDGRLSSPDLYQALVCGIIDAGGSVISIGIAPSPMLYFADKLLQPQASIMITASHNPKDDNGFKMLFQGKSFFDQQIQQLLAKILITDWTNIPIEFLTNKVEEIDLTQQYIDRILQEITINSELLVAWDPANGAAGKIIELLTTKLANKNIVINSQIDGNFPNHHPDPTVPENLDQLMQIVLTDNCDLGLAFDGDADRIVIISKQGRIILGDQILCILAKDVIDNNPNATIIMDIKTSGAIFEQINSYGGAAILWKTGHSHIKNKILASKALLAGETSGHIFFADKYYGYDDGIYAALRFLDLLSRSEKSLDQLIDQLPKYYNSPEIKISVTDDIKFKIIEQIKTDLIAENIAFNDIDGIRFTKGKSWWLIRASNTESKIIVKYESDSLEGLSNIQVELTALLTKYGLKIS